MASVTSKNGESIVAPKWVMFVVPIVTALVGLAFGALGILTITVTQQQLAAAVAQREKVTAERWDAQRREQELLLRLLQEREDRWKEKYDRLADKVERLTETRP